MRTHIKKTAAVLALLTAVSAYSGDFFRNRGGIAFRGTYWSMDLSDPAIMVRNNGLFNSRVEVGGMGGWMTLLSGIGERGAIEFSLGGVAHVEVIERGLFDEFVDVNAAMPVLVGYQYPLFASRNTSAFQPYVSGGAGPYLMSHIITTNEDCCEDDDVTVRNRVKPGMYVGAGGYFLLSNWFAVHTDMRYHLVNFTTGNEFSGFEVGVGLAFFWRR